MKIQSVAKLYQVSKIYTGDGNETPAVRKVTLKVQAGEMLALVGPSGSGKTTLLSLIAGLLKPTRGSVYLFNEPLENYTVIELQRLRACKMGFVFQNFLLLEGLSVLENLLIVQRFAGKNRRQSLNDARNLLEQLQIAHLMSKLPTQLSQGEKQRVAIARALANEPELILADEPTANLESEQGFEIIQLLKDQSNQRNAAVVVATHDLRMVQQVNRIVRLEDGKIVS